MTAILGLPVLVNPRARLGCPNQTNGKAFTISHVWVSSASAVIGGAAPQTSIQMSRAIRSLPSGRNDVADLVDARRG